MKSTLYRLFLYLFTLVFFLIFIGSIFSNKSLIYAENPFIILIMFILTTLFFISIYNLFFKKMENISLKKELKIASFLILIFLLLQCIYAYVCICCPIWDWQNVMDSARNYVEISPSVVNWSYFQMFPNNNALLYLEIILFKFLKLLGLFTIKKSIVFTVFVNLLCIDLSVLFLYLTVRNIFNKKMALFSLVLCIFSYAFYSYIPVFYTDTATMFFPILLIYLYTKFLKTNNTKYLFFLGIIAFIGYKFKPTVIITLIAILIDIFLRFKTKKVFFNYTILIIPLSISLLLISFLELKFSIFPYDVKNNNKEIPYTHWIMMGMTERKSGNFNRDFIGWYNPDSLDYTLSFDTTAERKKANIKKIKEQYNEYGFINYTKFLYRKLLFTWSDSTFYAPALVAGPQLFHKDDSFLATLPHSSTYKSLLFKQTIGLFLFMYFFMIIGAIYNLKKKTFQLNYSFLSIFGLMLFLLIWEDSSRYLLNYIPLMLLCTIYGFSAIISRKEKNVANVISEGYVKESLRGKKVMKKDPILYVVVPCYNEQEVLYETTKQLKEKMTTLIKTKTISAKSKVMYVNDGSKDKTWEIIKDINKKENLFTGISLSRNRGHQNALLGGLMTAKNYADVVISMDADLQDDINAIDEMLEKYKSGSDIVYGVRSARKKDTWFKRVTAEGFYKFMKILGVDCVYNHADYRLTSKRVLEEFSNFKEVNLFLRGMFPLVGFNSSVVYYERNERFAGESKYPLKKMLNFAWDGITSFSVKPLRLICTLGFLILFVSFGIMIYSLIRKLTGNTVDGWTFLAISIWFIGAIQMISIGIIGEYVGKMYAESKARPRYIISENLEEK